MSADLAEGTLAELGLAKEEVRGCVVRSVERRIPLVLVLAVHELEVRVGVHAQDALEFANLDVSGRQELANLGFELVGRNGQARLFELLAELVVVCHGRLADVGGRWP